MGEGWEELSMGNKSEHSRVVLISPASAGAFSQ
jgi:hypothetical protein